MDKEQVLKNYDLVTKAREICEGHGTLLYLTYAGSTLYGTTLDDSDLDLKGIYLPDKKKQLLGGHQRVLRFTTGNDKSKNSSGDLDIEIFSVQEWLRLISNGEPNAISMSHCAFACADTSVHYSIRMTLYRAPGFDMEDIVRNTLDIKSQNLAVRYIHHQARGYGLDGTALDVMRRARVAMLKYEHIHSGDMKFREVAHDILDELMAKYPTEISCTLNNNEEVWKLAGKGLQPTTLAKVIQQVDQQIDQRSIRLKEAKEGKGINWGDQSHIFRASYELRTVIDWINGKFVYGLYPYPDQVRELIKSVKRGEYTWVACASMINTALNELQPLIERLPTVDKEQSFMLVSDYVMKLYDDFYPQTF